MQLLRKLIRHILQEEWKNPTPNRLGRHIFPGASSKAEEEFLTKKDDRIKRGASPTDYRVNLATTFEEIVDELRDEPEFFSIENFVNYKVDNEEFDFSAAELQALSRNLDYEKRGMREALPPQNVVKFVKNSLIDWGLTFKPREAQKHFRGAMSSAHGASRYAGMGGGGTGFSSSFDKDTGEVHHNIGLGGGPGVIGGGYKWDANDPRNLSMGSTRKKR